MKLKAGLVLDRSGDAIIDNLDGDPASLGQGLLAASSTFLIAEKPQAACNSSTSSSCGTPCYRREDCDISKDLVCALIGVGNFPIAASWEDFRCAFVKNAAALTKVTEKSAACSTGRCLLDADGTLFIPKAASDVTWDRGKSATQGRNQSNSNSNSNSTLSQPPQTRFNSLGHDPNATTTEKNSTYGHYPAYSLFCPCNCTYVSMACCGSQHVIEDSQFRINMTLPPENSTMTCDTSGGGWTSTTSETSMPTATQSVKVTEDTNTADHLASKLADTDLRSAALSPSAPALVLIQSGIPSPSRSNDTDHLSVDSNSEEFS